MKSNRSNFLRSSALETTLRSSLQSVDILLTTGGVSMGELDLLKPTIERSLNGKIHFGRVAMKPGKPTTFASITVKSSENGEPQEKLLFALPGNPASAAVTFHLFALPALQQFAGFEKERCGLPKVKVVLGEDVRLDAKRREYHRVVISPGNSHGEGGEEGKLYARSTGFQRSSRIASFRGANGLLCLPVGEGVLKRGEMCEALVMGRLG
jgi:gephyrin